MDLQRFDGSSFTSGRRAVPHSVFVTLKFLDLKTSELWKDVCCDGVRMEGNVGEGSLG